MADPDSRLNSGGFAPPASPARSLARRYAGARRSRGSLAVARSRLEVTITDGRGRSARAPGLAIWLRRVAPRGARGGLAIALVTDARVRALNRTYRRKDAATDVLSFPSTDAGGGHLGDIAIATGVARRQARAAGHSYAAELKVLALHGLLHLLGYDHEDPADAGRMVRLERRLRARGGLRAGLIERTRLRGPGGRAASPRKARRPKADQR